MFALSASSPNIHQDVKKFLRIHGKSIKGSRPQTMETYQDIFNSDNSNIDNSERTIVLQRSERQTNIRLESLERRLRANEKARRELEAEIEENRRNSQRMQEENDRLREDLARIKTELEDSQMIEKELNIKMRSNEIILEEVTEKLTCLECDHTNLKEQIAATVLENEDEFTNFDATSENVIELIKKERESRIKETSEVVRLTQKIRRMEDQLMKNQNHVSKLLHQVELVSKTNTERIDIQKEENIMEIETSNSLKMNIKMMEIEAEKRRRNLDVITAELRWLKKQKRDLENNEKNNQILLRSFEAEKRSFTETISTLLGLELTADDLEIKKAVRRLLNELEETKTSQLRLEREYHIVEGQLLEQAKHQRNALFRARTAEEEQTILLDKINTLLQEIKAGELELKEKDSKIEQLESVIQKINSTLGLPNEKGDKELINRLEDLTIYEKLFQTTIHPGTIQKFSTTKPHGAAAAHAICSKSSWERWDKRLLTAVTLESIKAADSEKFLLRKRLNEKEKKIRELEKERKEVMSQKNPRNNERIAK